MLKKIDIFILKKFLGTFFFSLLIFVVVIILFDLSDKLDDFLEKGATMSDIIFGYYIYFIPYFANLISFMFTFLAVLYFTSRMASRFEIVAMLSNGISFFRVVLSYMFPALIIASMTFFLNTYIIPPANNIRFDFEETYYRNYRYKNKDTNIHLQIEKDMYMYMQTFDNYTNTGHQFAIDKFSNNQLQEKLVAESIKWDSVSEKWSIRNYYIRRITDDFEDVTTGEQLDTALNLYPLELSIRKENYAESLNLPQLNKFIEQQETRGEKVELYLNEKYRRFAAPVSIFILTLIGLALGCKKVRGGVGAHVGFGLLICVVYIITMRISGSLALDTSMNPLLAVWLPNIIFGIVSLALIWNARK